MKSGRVTAAVVLAAAVSVLFAPQALAKVDNVKDPGRTNGNYPCIEKCQITAQLSGADANDPVTFTVNGTAIGTVTPKQDRGHVTASITWAAPGMGDFVITASQGSDQRSVTYSIQDIDVEKASKPS